MDFIDIDRHKYCHNYDNTDHPMIDKWHFPAGTVGERVARFDTVVFLMEGEVDFLFQDYPKTQIRKGDFVFVPVGGKVHFTCLGDTELLLVRMHEHVRLCETYGIKQLYDEVDRTYKLMVKSHCILGMVPPIVKYTESLEPFINGAFRCRYYHSLKVKEFFVLLMLFYTKDQLRNFFHLILSVDNAFMHFVQVHAPSCRSVKELAGALNYSESGFRRKFHEVFGEAPLPWMTRQKARGVYRDICENKKNLKQITEEYGFKAQSHLTAFCKSVFQKTPVEIRNQSLKCCDMKKK